MVKKEGGSMQDGSREILFGILEHISNMAQWNISMSKNTDDETEQSHLQSAKLKFQMALALIEEIESIDNTPATRPEPIPFMRKAAGAA